MDRQRSLKMKGRIRIYKPKTDPYNWEDANKIELPVYVTLLTTDLRSELSKFDEEELYAMSFGKVFKIFDRSTAVKRKKSENEDKREESKGVVCGSLKKPQLVSILWRLGASPVQKDDRTDREALRQILYDGGFDKKEVSKLSLEALRFYVGWLNATVNGMCDTIRELMIEKDLVYVAK